MFMYFKQFTFFYTSLQSTDTRIVVLSTCNVYTWYLHAGTVCILVQFSPQTVQSSWCIPRVCVHGSFMVVCSVALSLTCICCVGLPIY